MNVIKAAGVCLLVTSPAWASPVVSTYDDLAEGFLAQPYSYNGITYSAVNNVAGVFPDGSTFEPGGGVEGLGAELIVERATFLYNDFPTWGSGNNALTFGAAFIPGDNLSLGALSTVTMSLDTQADSASLDIAYFENGPWGGIDINFAAYLGGNLVGTDIITISDLGGRDNVAVGTMSIDGVVFDELRLFATLGGEFTGPRIMIDDLTYNPVPAPSALVAVLGVAGVSVRRRRRG